MVSEQLSITIYTKKGMLNGYISLSSGARLSDTLNDNLEDNQGVKNAFVSFSNVSLSGEEGIKSVMYSTVYIPKSYILIVTIPDLNVARGISAQSGVKSPPFVQKSTKLIRIDIEDYRLIGNMHCNEGETMMDVLNNNLMFLPLTEAKINNPQYDRWIDIAFLVLNKQEISAAYEVSAT